MSAELDDMPLLSDAGPTSSDSDDYSDISGARGQVIGGTFRLEHVIGRGGMGTVWQATHLKSGRLVAVKMIARHRLGSREVRARFAREIRAVTRLRSPFAVETYAYGETRKGIPYMVMELLEGETLEVKLARDGPVPLQTTVRIAVQVARALHQAHYMGIIHRDLKPANVFMMQTPRGLHCKVLDFGVAKLTEGDPETDLVTQTGFVLGTPEFMSPEQGRGLKDIDHRSDLFALGMLVYNMLVGEPPFRAASTAEVLFAVVSRPMPALRDRAKHLPEALEIWFQTACAYDPDARYQRAQDLAVALHDAGGFAGSAQVHLQL